MGERVRARASTSSSFSSTSSRQRDGKKINDSVYELWKPKGRPALQVVFFHGLQTRDFHEAHYRTWMCRKQSECWPQIWLARDFPEAHILAVRYDSSSCKTSTDGRLDMTQIGENLAEDLIVQAKVGHDIPVILVGHSVGGLAIKQVCLHARNYIHTEERRLIMEKFLDNVEGVVYYSTPHLGSKILENLSNTISARIKLQKSGAVLKHVKVFGKAGQRSNEEFRKLRQLKGWKACGFVEANKTKVDSFHDVVVSEASARYDVDTLQKMSGTDHFTICQPASPESSTYQRLHQFISARLYEADKKKTQLALCCSQQEFASFTVGLTEPVEDVRRLLQNSCTLAVLGMSGIGKATLVGEMSKEMKSGFHMTCFVDDTQAIMKDHRSEGRQVEELKNHIAQKLMDGSSNSIPSFSSRVRKDPTDKLILVILNNVESLSRDQIRYLQNLFIKNEASRMIITTSDRTVAECCDVVYKLSPLSYSNSWKLLVHYAFQGQEVAEGLLPCVDKVLKQCDGLPLALKVVGRYVGRSGKGVTDQRLWRDVLESLKSAEELSGDSRTRLWSILKLSYEGLTPAEQQMFLDIATDFFDRTRSLVFLEDVWDAAWGSAHMRLGNLERQCLIEIREEEIWMHTDLIREKKIWMHRQFRALGRSIACPERENLLKWTRIRQVHKVVSLLMDSESHGFVADTVGLEFDAVSADTITYTERYILSTREPFSAFRELRYLVLRRVESEIGEGAVLELPRNLVFLSWSDARLTTCPVSFCRLEKLVALELRDWSSMGCLPESMRALSNLKWLDLQGCTKLRDLPPALWELTKLEHLDISGTNVGEISEGVGDLRHLIVLRANGTRLTKIPSRLCGLEQLTTLNLRDSKLSEIPESVSRLANLEELDVGFSNVRMLPVSIGDLKKLVILNLDHTLISELPETIGDLKKLVTLKVDNTLISELPKTIGGLESLESLCLSSAPLIGLPDSIADLQHLEELDVSGTQLTALPESITRLRALRRLDLSDSRVSELPLSMGALQQLHHVSLERTPIKTLPPGFDELSELFQLCLEGCTQLQNAGDSLARLRGLALLTVEIFSQESSPKEWFAASNSRAAPWTGAETMTNDVGSGKAPKAGAGASSSRLTMTVPLAPPPQPITSPFSHLQWLTLVGCEELEELPGSWMAAVATLSNLQLLTLQSFDGIESLPNDFGEFFPCLEQLWLVQWKRLRELPKSMFTHLSGLRYLCLKGLPRMESLPEALGQLSRLKGLGLSGLSRMESLPEALGQLSQLTSLDLRGLSRMESLPEALGQLSRLEWLGVERCGRLATLPKCFSRVLSRLKGCKVEGCAKLKEQLESPTSELSTFTKRHNGYRCKPARE